MLALELTELHGLGLDLAFTGFDAKEIDDLLFRPNLGGTDPDALPCLPAQAVTTSGDLWRCDGHRVLCGDATSSTNVCQLLEGVIPVAMITDPPYGVNLEPQWRGQAGLNGCA